MFFLFLEWNKKIFFRNKKIEIHVLKTLFFCVGEAQEMQTTFKRMS
jgi:hypothetical protein